jgi:membrane fusion protein (multidrug efflux system)
MRFKPLPFALSLLAPALFVSGCREKEQPTAGPPSVEFIQVEQKDVPITREWVATLDGFVNAQIRAQVTGLLLKQNYANGSYVRKGAPLFEIDPRPFQAALDQANADLEQAKANLQRAEAQLGKTQLDVTRYTPLAKESAISQQELDDAVQANLAAKAQVEQGKAAIESSRAAAESAKLNLSFTQIVSPIDGVTAISTAQVGDFVGPQSGPLTTVSTVDPILASITPSEQDYLKSINYAMPRGLSEDSALRKLEWQLKLADGTIFPRKGRFDAIDRQVDVRTGAILVKIQFPNPGNVLRPGGFGNVSTVTRIQQGAVLVPQRAVSEMQGGYLVAVIGQDDKVSIRPVKMGQKVGTWWIVSEGLKTGERVVAEGVQQVQEGARVNPKPYHETPAIAEKLHKGNAS